MLVMNVNILLENPQIWYNTKKVSMKKWDICTCDQCEDDNDNTIKAEVLEEDPLAGY